MASVGARPGHEGGPATRGDGQSSGLTASLTLSAASPTSSLTNRWPCRPSFVLEAFVAAQIPGGFLDPALGLVDRSVSHMLSPFRSDGPTDGELPGSRPRRTRTGCGQATTSTPSMSSAVVSPGVSTASTRLERGDRHRELVEVGLAGGQALELQAGVHDGLDPAPAAVAPGPLDHLERQSGDQRHTEDAGQQQVHQAGSPIGAKTKIAMIITISRKLVPQRGCRRE